MTLADFYSRIDWSSAEEALTKWQNEHKKESANPEFSKKFREGLVAYALPTEIVGELPDWTEERQKTARVALAYAGVWGQICDMLVDLGFVEKNVPMEDSEKEQLTLSFN
jgi:hypothetical protein|tara:strand:- start:295 stop:624 length:330 start_codon:yes stop_codon:yes gene_type:complete